MDDWRKTQRLHWSRAFDASHHSWHGPGMTTPDLNLLVTLNAVLEEGSVVRAAERLRLSPSAMSRALGRVREAVGDPILVKAGRGMVPTPRAIELGDRVSQLVQEAVSVLQPATAPDLRRVTRSFTIRTSEGFVETFGSKLVAGVRTTAPGIQLRFITRHARDGAGLRDGSVDLETGVVDETTSPELLQMPLFIDHLVAVVRAGHPLSKARVTPARYAASGHIGVSRRTVDAGWIDEALAPSRLVRSVVTTVSGFAAAIALARASDLVATVPERHTAGLRKGTHSLRLPFTLPALTVSMLWHPRMHADPVHKWLRGCVSDTAGAK